jgi:hypothetical protein
LESRKQVIIMTHQTQDCCDVKFVCGVGIVAFVSLLFPLYMDLEPNLEYSELIENKYTPSEATRIAALAAAMPLLFDFLYDLSLPQNFNLPRFCLLAAVIAPNVIYLTIEHSHRNNGHKDMTPTSFVLSMATWCLFHCGLLAYLIGEVREKYLRQAVAFGAIFKCLEFAMVIIQVFVSNYIPRNVQFIYFCISELTMSLLLIWIVQHIKKVVDRRNENFASLYVIAIISTLAFSLYSYLPSYNEDAALLMLVLVTISLNTVASRMGQHDAQIAMVSLMYHLQSSLLLACYSNVSFSL